MAKPILPNLSTEEQQKIYEQLRFYNEGRVSFRISGAYLIVLPHGRIRCFSLWLYTPLLENGQILYIDNLSESIYESIRKVTVSLFHSSRKLFIVDYNLKRMETKGDDLVGFGKYRGHYLYEVVRIDPAYVSWIATKYTPRIPKQERFVLIARAYLSVHLDLQRHAPIKVSQYLGKKGELIKDLQVKITHVRLEDDPYKTHVTGFSAYFYVAQILYVQDKENNRAIIRIPALYPSMESGKLSAMERVYKVGEIIQIASARVSQVFKFKGIKYTRLNYVRLL